MWEGCWCGATGTALQFLNVQTLASTCSVDRHVYCWPLKVWRCDDVLVLIYCKIGGVTVSSKCGSIPRMDQDRGVCCISWVRGCINFKVTCGWMDIFCIMNDYISSRSPVMDEIYPTYCYCKSYIYDDHANVWYTKALFCAVVDIE